MVHLTLSDDEYVDRYYNRRLEYNASLVFDKLYLKTGNCFGDCPKIELTLEKGTNKILFNGISNCNYIGRTHITIDEEKLRKFENLFQWSNIDKIDSTQYYGVIDGWEMSIYFDYNKKSKTIRGAHWGMPFQVRPIINLLLFIVQEKNLI